MLRDHGKLTQPEIDHGAEEILGAAFAIDEMAAEILGDRWARLTDPERLQFLEALTRALRGMLLPYFVELNTVPSLRPAAEDWTVEGGSVSARYWLESPDSSEWFTFYLVDVDGSCRILDVVKGSRSLLASLKDQADDDLDDYGFPYMIAMLGDYDSLIIDDFESHEEGTLPAGWSWRSQDEDKNKPYRIRVEGGNRYLEATDEGESVILGKEVRWNLEEFPYISFRIRVNEIPEGGDERDNEKVDSAAGLYITLRKKFFGKIPESVKYVWSSTLPVGTAVRREGIGRPWQIVFGTGHEGLGEWRTYIFDLRDAYRDTFGGDPPSKPVGVGVLSDANSLKLRAYADYDDIRALRTAPREVTSGVVQIMPPIGNR